MDAVASSRSSVTACCSSPTAASSTVSVSASRVPSRICAARSSSASATRRCWAPSWRSRSMRLRCSSPAATIRTRDCWTRVSWALSSACRRAFSSASRAAAPTASISSGLSRRLGSWTSAASGSPSPSSVVTAPGRRQARRPGGLRVRVAPSVGEPEGDLQGRVVHRLREGARSSRGGTRSSSRTRSLTCVCASRAPADRRGALRERCDRRTATRRARRSRARRRRTS